jgi:hypothetical protein
MLYSSGDEPQLTITAGSGYTIVPALQLFFIILLFSTPKLAIFIIFALINYDKL